MVTLRSSDDELFEVSAQMIGAASGTIKKILESDHSAAPEVPLPNVAGPVLARVIEYCNHHYADTAPSSVFSSFSDVKRDTFDHFNHELTCGADQDTLIDLMLAADYLDVEGLSDLTCRRVAEHMSGKLPGEIRELFHIINDYTEEEDELLRELSWAFEGIDY